MAKLRVSEIMVCVNFIRSLKEDSNRKSVRLKFRVFTDKGKGILSISLCQRKVD